MFSMIKEKIYIAVLLIAAILLVCLNTYQTFTSNRTITSLSEDLTSEKQKNKNLNIEIDGLKSEKKVLEGRVSDLLLVDSTAKEIEESKKKLNQIEKTVEGIVDAINDRYKDLPKTDQNEQARRREITRERVKGVWLSLCLAVPTNTRCTETAK